ncbi:MAG: discoidin domain-containing protein [Phycisphaerae bacterium]|nr:discoidin domain-containing protein [Phycisphaerae bacterium]
MFKGNFLILLGLMMSVLSGCNDAESEKILIKPEATNAMIYRSNHVTVENFDSFKPIAAKFWAPKGTKNIALGKIVSASEEYCSCGELSNITDGKKNDSINGYVEMAPGLQWIQIDLEQQYDIYAIMVWHNFESYRVYKDVIIQLSNDKNFGDFVTVFNNDHDNTASQLGLGPGDGKNYYENKYGKFIDTKAMKARYVRLYSNGNYHSIYNHYIEVEVYGI